MLIVVLDQTTSLVLSELGKLVKLEQMRYAKIPSLQEEVPVTPERIADLGMMDISEYDHLTEESLFFAVSSAAMALYRLSIESHIMQSEKTHNSMQEEVDTSMYDTPADFGCHDNAYDDEDGETSAYYMHGVFEGSKQGKHDQKKWKNFTKSPSARSYDLGTDSPYGHRGTGPQQNAEDDQSTLHGGSQIQKSVEVESAADFERQLPYDYAETSAKPKKKTKAKHLHFCRVLLTSRAGSGILLFIMIR
ncbi:hypothetical protein OIU77_002484 [Salix suchowensis]|uniref:Uncharacterized protein n=1 Tax=Salix suchowensis TaxID=1278906 RepID=A0ABQ9AY64_9ROSI|nr:hypothetical protein OIU77_002484 [Salix suchowensis]